MTLNGLPMEYRCNGYCGQIALDLVHIVLCLDETPMVNCSQ